MKPLIPVSGPALLPTIILVLLLLPIALTLLQLCFLLLAGALIIALTPAMLSEIIRLVATMIALFGVSRFLTARSYLVTPLLAIAILPRQIPLTPAIPQAHMIPLPHRVAQAVLLLVLLVAPTTLTEVSLGLTTNLVLRLSPTLLFRMEKTLAIQMLLRNVILELTVLLLFVLPTASMQTDGILIPMTHELGQMFPKRHLLLLFAIIEHG